MIEPLGDQEGEISPAMDATGHSPPAAYASPPPSFGEGHGMHTENPRRITGRLFSICRFRQPKP